MSRHFSDDHILTFEEISAMLQLGYKYQIEHLRHEAIRRLKQCFPESLDDFVFSGTQADLLDQPTERREFPADISQTH